MAVILARSFVSIPYANTASIPIAVTMAVLKVWLHSLQWGYPLAKHHNVY